jgi:ribosome-associated heat shock protein Hsp15
MDDSIRIDKWLWAVRLYKTRSIATEACRAGRVKIHDQAVKPSREIKTGDILVISFPPMVKTVKVLLTQGNRVSAKLVPGLMEDLTPAEEYEKLKQKGEEEFEFRMRGTGRPTKRERREIEYLKRILDK